MPKAPNCSARPLLWAAAVATAGLLAAGRVSADDVGGAAEMPESVSACDVEWDGLGRSSADSMPIGNGDIGLNVWAEATGDVCLYVGKTDAWSEENTGPLGLLKLGRIRMSLTPNPFADGSTVRQALRLYDGEIRITGGPAVQTATVRVWVDANRPVIRVACQSSSPVSVRVAYETWRTRKEGPVSPDVIVPGLADRVEWYHHNGGGAVPQLADRTFGAAIKGPGLVNDGDAALRSAAPAVDQLVSIYPLTVHPATPEQWRAALARGIADVDGVAGVGVGGDSALSAHRQWWHDFWHRSWIVVSGDEAATTVTRGATLQRFVTACGGRGAYPIKFNGSTFTVDHPAFETGRDRQSGRPTVADVTADYRRWGGQFWFQNTRAMYWPRLMAGDLDELQPLFRMYRATLAGNAQLVRRYYGHGGAYFAETAPFYGGLKRLVPTAGTFTDHYFTPVLELSAMMLDYYDYTQDSAFARDTLLPIADAGLTFFAEHFKRDGDGKLLLDPDNAIEMYWRVHNPAPDIAGLHYVVGRLLALPESLTTATERTAWRTLQGELPPLPRGTSKAGKAVLLPYAGEQTAKAGNTENPELYAIYPFRLFGLGKPELDLARDTFDARKIRTTGCWVQDPIQAAYLGMAAVAKRDVTVNFTRREPRLKFPAFWVAANDYDPDEDNGGNGENGLQKMLMHCDDRRILLLPAWPKAWDVDFKLNAPYATAVTGSVRQGKLVSLTVAPPARRADVTVADPR